MAGAEQTSTPKKQTATEGKRILYLLPIEHTKLANYTWFFLVYYMRNLAPHTSAAVLDPSATLPPIMDAPQQSPRKRGRPRKSLGND